MTPPAPWTPTAHAFAQHQFSHVANFWKQGRQASFRLEALPCGQAELNLTFQLPPASEVVPPPAQVYPTDVPQRHIQPLFPEGCFPKKSDSGAKLKTVSPKRRRKSYQRSVLHRAALAMSSLPPPKSGSLLEHKTCNILAAERLRLMRFDNRLIIDSFQKAICILKW